MKVQEEFEAREFNPKRAGLIASYVQQIREIGRAVGSGHLLLAPFGTHEVWVRETQTDRVVAYSAMEADRGSSIEEFVGDYLV